jgi:micrococcal nuclease
MRIRLELSCWGVIALLAMSPDPVLAQRPLDAAEPARRMSRECAIERVVDGDTFVCAGGERVRLLLIDTPELSQRPYGDSARTAARTLLPVGAHVRLERDVELRDRYGRTLAYVYQGDVFVNRELVRRGMAVVSVYPPNVREVEALRAAADSARAERKGLWSGSAFECSPRDYRARRCR